jgi:hypothetical protein
MKTTKKISNIEHHFVVKVSQLKNGKWQYEIDNDLLDAFFTEGFYYDRDEQQWLNKVSPEVGATDQVISRILSGKLEK